MRPHRWRAPPDLRQAVLPPVCEIDLTVTLGQVQLLLPVGVRVESRVSAFAADVLASQQPAGTTGLPTRVLG